MGLFDKLLGKTGSTSNSEAERIPAEKNTVYAPVAGELIALSEFPDECFSEGILGQGCGIRPGEAVVKAPFNGKVISLQESCHALGLLSDDGLELLVHVGVDTVSMGGQGFTPLVELGDQIVTGQELLKFSTAKIQAAGYDTSVAVVLTNSDDYSTVKVKGPGSVYFGNSIITAIK
nr:PTS glucose transporter subunit IIA [uncultured Clostridium sp.]